MGLKNISAAVIFALLSSCALAQTIEVMSYAPLKRAGGTQDHAYQVMSVRSQARLATDANAALIINNMRANTPLLTLQTEMIGFAVGDPNNPNPGPPPALPALIASNALFTAPGTSLMTNNVTVNNGFFYAAQDPVIAAVANVDANFTGAQFLTAFYPFKRVHPREKARAVNRDLITARNLPALTYPFHLR